MNLKNIHWLLVAALVLAFTPAANAASKEIPVEDFVGFPEFESATISPDGKYLAVTMPDRGQTGLQIIDISNPDDGFKATAAYRFPKLTHVHNVYWASDDRVVFETTREYDLVGDITPRLTGMIYAMNADGSNKMLINGSNRTFTGDWGYVISPLPNDPDQVLIYRKHYGQTAPEAVLLHIRKGDDTVVATSPFKSDNAGDNGFIIDSKGNVRAAYKYNGEDESIDFALRTTKSEEWTIRHFGKQGSFNPVGFLPDDETLVISNAGQPLGLFSFDMETGERKPLVTDSISSVRRTIRALHSPAVIGAVFEPDYPVRKFVDIDHPDIALYRMLGDAFGKFDINITSATRDGHFALLAVTGDRMPTDFYLFNTETKKADYLLSSMQWLDPAELAERRPVRFKARDGMEIRGYLTLPNGKEATDLPLVTIVHGGPHGPFDSWLYDYEAQLLASQGYAVMQTNYRGSGGYGRRFMEAGWKRWGTEIQNDIEDGVKWVIDQGIADPERVCIYGASFGGYSVLSQLTRQPDMYKCGFAFVGIYDLQKMTQAGDIQQREEGRAFLERVLPTDIEERHSQSPVNFVNRIKAGLYVAHGQEDERAHAIHYYELLDALENAGIPHQTMLKHKEAHGFFDTDNRIELYTEMLDFIDEHIGD